MRSLISTAALGAFVVGGGPAWSNQGAIVTALAGDASTSGGSVIGQDVLGDDEVLELDETGGCSILLDEKAVVELCGETRVSFTADPDRDVRIVNVESGNLQMFVESGASNERIEIHTPAAIATILGTVVYVTVNPLTGTSTFASLKSRVEIRDREKSAQPGTTIGALEQLTVAPGEEHKKKTLSPTEIGALGECLMDFRNLALRSARGNRETLAMDRLLDVDRAAFERGFEKRESDSEDIESDDVIDVTDTEVFRSKFLDGSPGNARPPCVIHVPPIPGDHCSLEDPN